MTPDDDGYDDGYGDFDDDTSTEEEEEDQPQKGGLWNPWNSRRK